MAQVIKLKRGLESARVQAGNVPVAGEIIISSPSGSAFDRVFLGDGTTQGGREIAYLSTTLGGTVPSLTVTGDLTVQGTMTTVDSQQVNIGDAIIMLNAATTGAPSEDAGFEIERGNSGNVSILWNETTNQWEATGIGANETLTGTPSKILVSADIGATVQAWDADLVAIAALAGTSGLLKKTAVDTWTLDTAAYSTTTGTVTSIATSGAITGGTITSTGTISHSTEDGYLHVPATSTTNNGKVLTAGATAGSLSWTTPTPTTGAVTDVTAGAGMTQTGTSTLNPTLNIIANADGSIVVNADDIQVGTIDGGSF